MRVSSAVHTSLTESVAVEVDEASARYFSPRDTFVRRTLNFVISSQSLSKPATTLGYERS